ncbi:MAG TPA: hypothetical protein VN036_15715 [Devosia sp.]|nr:hypothetical protein [Devosia sp.]
MKTSILALGFVLAASSAAFACTAEELQAKAMEVSTKVQTVIAAHPEKATDITAKFTALQTNPPTDVESACKVYDDLLAEIEAL